MVNSIIQSIIRHKPNVIQDSINLIWPHDELLLPAGRHIMTYHIFIYTYIIVDFEYV